MGSGESKPIQLVFPSHRMPYTVPFSVVPQLKSEIEKILQEMEATEFAPDIERPRPGDWVLVDVAKAAIIYELFLAKFVIPGGDYMVLPMRASVLSEEELVEKIKDYDFTRQTDPSQTTYYSVKPIKLILPSHGMPFVVPFDTVAELASTIDKILGDIKTSSPEANFSRRQKLNGLALECPSPNDWVFVDVLNASIIYKSYLGTLLVSGGEYIALPMRASVLSRDDMKEAIKNVISARRPEPRRHAPSSGTDSTWGSDTQTPTQSQFGDEQSGDYVQLEITRLDLNSAIQQYSISKTWTINLLMVSLNTSPGAELVESDGIRMRFVRSSRLTLEEVGWSGRGERVKVSVVPPATGSGSGKKKKKGFKESGPSIGGALVTRKRGF